MLRGLRTLRETHKKNMLTVLFTKKDSIYKKLNCDCYDIQRNALTYKENEPIIAHPPCRTWGNYSHKALGNKKEKQLSLWALRLVRRNGTGKTI